MESKHAEANRTVAPEETLADVAPPQERAAVPEGTSVGRYRIAETLGEGAMGTVYAAHDPELDREVAIKVVRPEYCRSPRHRERIKREAQALALLSHPNVVTVYDVGSFEQGLFIAMELVRGSTLGDWWTSKEVDEVLDCLTEAGQGLAAAHEAGIVHRDFKPANVLVGLDGRPRVGDFGLAGALDDVLTAEFTANLRGEGLTQSGSVMGTPAYMSPERLQGDSATTASDQFAFAITVYEALVGQRPYAGSDGKTLTRAALAHQVEFPSDSDVPRRVRAIIRRAVSPHPGDRYPSMRALLQELDRVPRRRWPWVIGTAAAVGVVAAVVPTRAPADCTIEDQTWRRAELEDALARRGDLPARASAEVIRHLDAFADAWTDAREQACGLPPGDERVAFERCLRASSRRFQAAIAVSADDATPSDELGAVSAQLPDPFGCADPSLRAFPLPADPAAREAIERADDTLATARSLLAAGRASEVLPMLEALDVAALDHPPLEIRISVVRGDALRVLRRPEEASTVLEAAFDEASQHGLDALALRAAVSSTLAALEGRDRDQQKRWINIASGLNDRVESKHWQVPLLRARSDMHAAAGEYGLSRDALQQALDLLLDERPVRHEAVGTIEGTIASLYLQQRLYDDAGTHVERAIDALAQAGKLHSGYGRFAMRIQTRVALQARRPEDALVYNEAAIEAMAALPDPAPSEVAQDLSTRGDIYASMGNYEAAKALQRRAIRTAEEGMSSDDPLVGRLRSHYAVTLLRTRDWSEARALVRDALDDCVAVMGAKAACASSGHHNLAETLAGMDRYDEAFDHYKQALALFEARYGEDSSALAYPLTGIGEVHLARGQPGLARVMLERALKLSPETLDGAKERAETEAALARALWADPLSSEGDRARALELAGGAYEVFASFPGYEPERDALGAWLESL